jgi:hypothetical protein
MRERERLPGRAHRFMGCGRMGAVGRAGESGLLDKKGFQNLIKYFPFNAK